MDTNIQTYRNRERVEAYRSVACMVIRTPQGNKTVEIGDFVVTYKEGTRAVLDADTFKQKYEVIADGNK